MGASRTSNRDVLDAIEAQTASIDKLVNALTAGSIATQPAVQAGPTTNGGEIEVDEAYLQHMTVKAAEHATAKGEEVVLYARRNKANETKLAYALRPRYEDILSKQPSCLGPVGSFKP